MINLFTFCAKLCEFLVAKTVQNFVNFQPFRHDVCKKSIFSHFFTNFFYSLFNIFCLDNHLNTFSHFHRPYYYHYYIKNNINNRKV